MVKLTDVAGIGPVAAKLLVEHNIKTVEALASVSLVELQKVSGFGGDIRARAIKKAAADCLRKAAKQPIAPVKSVAIVKKTAGDRAEISQVLRQAETSKVAGKKKNKKDDKKTEKVKDKNKKEKNKAKKEKNKDRKKRGKSKKKS